MQERIAKGSLRSLLSFENGIDFWSNDYLGLAKFRQTIDLQGSTGSRLISGNTKLSEDIEAKLAAFYQAEAGLFFNSGYDANVGIFSSLPQKGDTVLYDELIHASVRDGLRMSFAHSFSFSHNDLTDLKAKLEKAKGTVFVAVESLYSMDGDYAPLKEMVELCKPYHALLIVDEAHAGGIIGVAGKGFCVHEQVEQSVFLRVLTFGKAYGAHGALVCCSQDVRSYLVNFARSFIYSTALPSSVHQHILHKVTVEATDELRNQLYATIQTYNSIFGIHEKQLSPIKTLLFESIKECCERAEVFQQKGIAVKAILPPTVPENKPRIRICLHAFNTLEQIEILSQ